MYSKKRFGVRPSTKQAIEFKDELNNVPSESCTHRPYLSLIAYKEKVRRQIMARAMELAQNEDAVVHVKDGKPLTAKGARMLGAPWNESTNSL